MQKAFGAKRIFNGENWIENKLVLIKNGLVEKLISKDEATGDFEWFDEAMIIPAFIDVQVYGSGGKLFSAFSEASTLELMEKNFREEGTIVFQPTLATNTMEVFKKAIDALKDYRQRGGKAVYGLHLEGPWLNPTKRGAHIEAWIHPPTKEEVRDLLDYGEGLISMITIAPEVCSKEIIQLILDRGIILSAGHSNAGLEEAIEGFENGITAVTHLYNAMSPLHHRAPGLVGAALNHNKVSASIIPDGFHVDYPAVSIAKKIMGERLFAITDAVTATESGPYQHERAGDKYECNGILSGSALSMFKAMVNLVKFAGIELGEASRMCSLYPARVLGCEDRFGKIAPGYAGQFLVISKQLELVRVIT